MAYDNKEKQEAIAVSLREDEKAERRIAVEYAADCLTVTVEPGAVYDELLFLRDKPDLLFKQLIDITAADYPGDEKRFDVIYHLLSPRHNTRLRLRARAGEGEALPSACPLFASAGWFEREVWDMFGIPFAGNPDLRRILSDYGFQGHPLRKDFPLTGYVELRYDTAKKRIVYEDVTLDQEFRDFDFMRPWEGTEYRDDEQAADA